MANENVAGKRMSDYPTVNDTTKVSAAQKEAFMADAVVVGVGSKPSGQTGKVNYGIPLSEIKPDVPVIDVQVGGTSVVSNGVAAVPAQVNADWESASGVTAILNKPDMSSYALQSALEALEAKYTSLDERVKKLETPTT